jgi:disulfide bond formation protein DsbB
MYPLVVVLGVATVEERASVYRTALPLAVGGAAIAVYHSWLQYTPTSARCTFGEVSCATIQYRIGGLTVPNLSLVAFTLLSIALIVVALRSKR